MCTSLTDRSDLVVIFQRVHLLSFKLHYRHLSRKMQLPVTLRARFTIKSLAESRTYELKWLHGLEFEIYRLQPWISQQFRKDICLGRCLDSRKRVETCMCWLSPVATNVNHRGTESKGKVWTSTNRAPAHHYHTLSWYEHPGICQYIHHKLYHTFISSAYSLSSTIDSVVVIVRQTSQEVERAAISCSISSSVLICYWIYNFTSIVILLYTKAAITES